MRKKTPGGGTQTKGAAIKDAHKDTRASCLKALGFCFLFSRAASILGFPAISLTGFPCRIAGRSKGRQVA